MGVAGSWGFGQSQLLTPCCTLQSSHALTSPLGRAAPLCLLVGPRDSSPLLFLFFVTIIPVPSQSIVLPKMDGQVRGLPIRGDLGF